MPSVLRSILPLALAGLLAGCGGGLSLTIGDDDHHHHGDDFWEPVFSGRSASLDVDASVNALDGTWSTDDTEITRVVRFGATSLDPETCRFQFYGLRQEGENRLLDGEIRYLPTSLAPRKVFIGIDRREYLLEGGSWTVNGDTGRVTFTDARLDSLDDTSNETLTISGSVPLPRARANGC